MQIKADFRRRAKVGESIPNLNIEILNRLTQVKGLWSDGAKVADVFFSPGTGESAATDLSSCLSSGIRGAISYASRLPAAIQDRAISDDFLVLEFDTDSVNFNFFCTEVFPEIVQIFHPYRACVITDIDSDLDDFEQIAKEAQETGLDVDGRDTVFRLQALNFYDDDMCFRAFGLTPQQIEDLLENVALAAAQKAMVVKFI